MRPARAIHDAPSRDDDFAVRVGLDFVKLSGGERFAEASVVRDPGRIGQDQLVRVHLDELSGVVVSNRPDEDAFTDRVGVILHGGRDAQQWGEALGEFLRLFEGEIVEIHVIILSYAAFTPWGEENLNSVASTRAFIRVALVRARIGISLD